MKKLIIIPIALLFVLCLFQSCEKQQANTEIENIVEIENDADEIIEDFGDEVQAEDRATSITGVEYVGGSPLAASDTCHRQKDEGALILDLSSAPKNVKITGSDFGATQTLTSPKAGVNAYVSKVFFTFKQSGKNGFVDTTEVPTNKIISWSPTEIVVSGILTPKSGIFQRDFKKFTYKAFVKTAKLLIDSTFNKEVQKTKSRPVITQKKWISLWYARI